MSICKVAGVQSELEVFEDRLTITPKGALGFLNHGLKGTKTIPFRSITAIQFKEVGGVTSGYIQFSLLGGIESRGGLFSAASDENTFMFSQEHDNANMAKIQAYIESRMGSSPAVQAVPSPVGVADELAKLAGLRDQDILSDEEFRAAKAKLMGGGAMTSAGEMPTSAPILEQFGHVEEQDAIDLENRRVGIGLALGTILMPFIFSWFTLRKGHSISSRIVAFGWLAVVVALSQ
jgi:hypothetical protein